SLRTETFSLSSLRLDPRELGAEGLAARTAGAVFSHRQFDDDNLAIGNVLDAARMGLLPPARLATMRTRKTSRCATTPHHAHARLASIHACDPPGVLS